MSKVNETAIALSKTKLVINSIGSVAIVLIGVWLIRDVSLSQEGGARLLYLVAGSGATGFFGLVAVWSARKFFDKKPGLILGNNGMTDNSSGISGGHIPWSDITGTKIMKINFQKMLVIMLRNPDEYIRQGNKLQRMAKRANYKMCGSPIAISAHALNIKFSNLTALLNEYLQQYSNK